MADLHAHLSADEAARVRHHLDACIDTQRTAASATPTASGAWTRCAPTSSSPCAPATPPTPPAPARSRSSSPSPPCSATTSTPARSTATPPPPACSASSPTTPPPGGDPSSSTATATSKPSAPARYRPSALLERTVKLHDRTCQFPGCRRRATHSETDHVTPFDHDNPGRGGLTVLENLHTLCKRHHRLKHEAGWTITRKDGITHWRSPHGRRYTKPAYRYPGPPPPDAADDPPPY